MFESFPEGREAKHKNYYSDFQPPRQGAIVKNIVFTEAIGFSIHYFWYIILNHFKSMEVVMSHRCGSVAGRYRCTAQYKQYNKFTIKVQYKQVSEGFEMVLAYDDISKVLKKSIADIPDFDTSKYKKYLLFNNTRYDERATLKPRDYLFPIKVSIKATKEELVQYVEVIRELIDQVYQFSSMYWKSISQQNLPVTTKYPEMVAEIFPHFEHNHLPEFGKENLWFL